MTRRLMDRISHLISVPDLSLEPGPRRRRIAGAALAGLVAGALLLAPALGARAAHAQGPMDIGILSPSFAELPQSVQPGQSFRLVASTAPNAQCVGQVTFRHLPPVVLDEQSASGGVCAWIVEVPPTLRNGNASIAIDISRGGQGWFLAGVFYVNAPGESR